MSFKAYGPRASPPPSAVPSTRRRLQGHPHRGLGLALLCLLCYSLLRAAQGAWWAASLRRSGPCQADNEVRCRFAAAAATPSVRRLAWWPTYHPYPAPTDCRAPGASASSRDPHLCSCSPWNSMSRGRIRMQPGQPPTRS